MPGLFQMQTIAGTIDQPKSTETTWAFPGWRVVFIAAAAMVATLPGRTVGLSLITEPLLADLQVARTTYADWTLAATILGATFALGCGKLLDRWGVRVTLSFAILLLALTTLALGWMATTANLWVFLILSRGLGQSSLSTASVTSVGKWFDQQLGFAMAVFSAAVAVGFAVVIPLFGALITEETWRACWVNLGAALVVLAAVAFVLLPKSQGFLGSGVVKGQGGERGEFVGWTEALRTSTFWIFTVSTSLYYLVLSGLTLFCESVLQELGFDHGMFLAAMGMMMFAGLLGNFLAGWLSTRYVVTRLLAGSLLLLAVVLIGIPRLQSTWQLLTIFAIYGVCGGAFAVLFFVGYSRAFGQQELGKIQGAAQVFGVTASALGPKLLAETQLATGSYLPVLSWLAPAALVLAAIAWFAHMPRPVDVTSAPTAS